VVLPPRSRCSTLFPYTTLFRSFLSLCQRFEVLLSDPLTDPNARFTLTPRYLLYTALPVNSTANPEFRRLVVKSGEFKSPQYVEAPMPNPSSSFWLLTEVVIKSKQKIAVKYDLNI